MRVALDSNVLLRYLTLDDPVQSPIAVAVIESAEQIFVAAIVLCETVWVLKRAYRFKNKAIATVLREFIESATVEVDRPLAEAGLVSLEAGGDFADGVVLFEAERSKVEELVTFDGSFVTISRSARLRLL